MKEALGTIAVCVATALCCLIAALVVFG